MAARKIVNESEVIRWFEEGRTYAWMVEEYRRKYGIETVQSMWGNFRRRRGLDRRLTRDDHLIPWAVKPEHRWAYPVIMLRTEARRRDGKTLTGNDSDRLATWLRMLDDENRVVHYDAGTTEGFHYVQREPGDRDIVRAPERRTGRPARS
ncbi:hypothetical protein [Kitasatospora sp. DSM 101779]|uniref:hypothetical protein n=1 Tax=Kitasatospora sp. DSM 101779 TaxID=2853165 RepID=UPI0021DB1012|nr:hypothetical protein [Kitasatospora sp. DSM 101779]MCU7821421.1 hypothetical protein [Kitasatospora sp. DSM 101779]